MHPDEIRTLVLDALALTNQTRVADQQLEVSATAPVFGPPSPLDSLGLVALLMLKARDPRNWQWIAGGKDDRDEEEAEDGRRAHRAGR